MKATSDVHYAAFVGIDWADRKHDVCLQPAGCDKREFSVLAHRPESLQPWAQGLRRRRFQGGLIAVYLELTKGPLVSALQRNESLGLFLINLATLAKHRGTFCLRHAGVQNAPDGLLPRTQRALSTHDRAARAGDPNCRATENRRARPGAAGSISDLHHRFGTRRLNPLEDGIPQLPTRSPGPCARCVPPPQPPRSPHGHRWAAAGRCRRRR
jgi:hypothetical protein